MPSPKPSLYFITTELPWPAISGGRIKTFRLLQFLSNHYEVRLACAHGQYTKDTLDQLREESGVKSVQVFGSLRPRNAINWFLAIAQFPTLNCFRVYSKKMESIMRWGIEQSDITIVDHLEMMEMIPEALVSSVIYHSHNAECKLWSDFAQLETNPVKKWILEWEAERVKIFERWAIKSANFTFAAPNDQDLLMDASEVDSDNFRLTYHLGDESYLDKPKIDLQSNAQRLLFMGTLSWMPNKDGIRWYIDHVWAQVKTQLPDAELVICGSGATDQQLAQFESADGVSYLGFVEDLNAVMEGCKATVVPLRFGSGMKIKTLDAMYRGLPVVSSETGIEGLDIINGKHALVCENEKEWVENTIKVLTHQIDTDNLANLAKTLVRDKYTYPKIFEAMLKDIKQSIR